MVSHDFGEGVERLWGQLPPWSSLKRMMMDVVEEEDKLLEVEVMSISFLGRTTPDHISPDLVAEQALRDCISRHGVAARRYMTGSAHTQASKYCERLLCLFTSLVLEPVIVNSLPWGRLRKQPGSSQPVDN